MADFSDAIGYAQAHEVAWPRDPAADPARWGVHHGDPPPYNRLRGPVHARGSVSGVIRVRGEEVAAWGDPTRADLAFSVAKTYLALLAGVAHGRGLLPDPREPIAARLPGIGFDDPHNRDITWAQMLEQTSEWQGTCFGMPDQVEHNRRVAHDPEPPAGRKGEPRPLRRPGTFWEYNDVGSTSCRSPCCTCSAVPCRRCSRRRCWSRSAPAAISAGPLRRAWVELDGRRMQSVPGGSHWGGGVSISARTGAHRPVAARSRPACRPRPASWVDRMQQPCVVAPFYGWLAWLNREGTLFADASRESWFMIGAGGHYVWIDPAHEAVVAVRWIDPARAPGFVARRARTGART